MARVPVDGEVVASCRALAASVADDVQRFIDSHTTVGVERTTARAYGVEGVDDQGTPLANLLVDRYQKAGLTSRGIAFFLGRALWRVLGRSMRRPSGLPTVPISTTANKGQVQAKPARRSRLSPLTPSAESIAPETNVTPKKPISRSPYPAQVRHRRHGQHLRRRRPGQSRALRRRRHRRGDPRDRAVAPRLRALRAHDRRLRRHVRHAGELPHRPRAPATRRASEYRPLLQQTNYSSGLCMAEIAWMAAVERLDMLLNDAMYGILFRDINMRRTFVDQYFSRRIIARAASSSTPARTTTSPPPTPSTRPTPCWRRSSSTRRSRSAPGSRDEQMGLGHAFEIDTWIEDRFLLEIAQAQLVRQIFDRAIRSSGCRPPSTRPATSSRPRRTTRCSIWSASPPSSRSSSSAC